MILLGCLGRKGIRVGFMRIEYSRQAIKFISSQNKNVKGLFKKNQQISYWQISHIVVVKRYRTGRARFL